MNHQIAFFVISTELGGAEKSLLDFLETFKNNHHNFSVIVPKKNGPLIDELRKEGIDIVFLATPTFLLSLSRKHLIKSVILFIPSFFYSFVYLYKINKLLKKNSINTIHSTGLKFHLLLGLFALINKSYQIHIHVRDIISFNWIKVLFYFFNRQPHVHFIFNSHVTAHALPKINPLVIYNGFDSNHFSPGPSTLKQNLGLPEDSILIGIVGVIARWKGQREFINMASNINSQNPNVHFVIVGDEIYDTIGESGEMAHLKQLQKNYNLIDSLHFTGFQRNIRSIYRGLDILVHGSIKPEPFGRVIVEAMLCGCPVVASNKGGPLEIITKPNEGLLYEQGNILAMTSVIRSILESPETRDQMKTDGRQRALYFSLESYTSSLSQQLLK